MGIYINRTSKRKLGLFDKAKHLVEDGDAKWVEPPSRIPPWEDLGEDEVYVCVVQNVAFDAALVVWPKSEHDYIESVKDQDQRPYHWLIGKKDVIDKIADHPATPGDPKNPV